MFVQMHVRSDGKCARDRIKGWAMQADDGTTPSTFDGWAAAVELAPMTRMWQRLLENHVPTPRGRCRGCTQGGTGIPAVVWPCGPRTLAEAAATLHARRPAS